MANIAVSQITSSKEMRAFVRFNYELYKDCPQAVPDLLEDTLETFDPRRNPAFQPSSTHVPTPVGRGKTCASAG